MYCDDNHWMTVLLMVHTQLQLSFHYVITLGSGALQQEHMNN